MAEQKKTVAVLGAGIAGLTAAQELLERGFHVTIFDKCPRAEWGGRARSYLRQARSPVDGSVTGPKLPAEHGFHFFPGFYRHVDDTLGRTKLANGKPASSNLIPITEELLAVTGKPRILVPAAAPSRPGLLAAIRAFLQVPKDLAEVGLTKDDLSTFASKLWRFASSCPERRNAEYEGIDWRTFVESIDRSEEYYWYLASGLTRTLVAARARQASTKTMGNVALQLLLCLTEEGNSTDRVLNGPTTDVWIAPWLAHLEREHGAAFTTREKVEIRGLEVTGDRVSAVSTSKGHEPFDHVVCALSLEAVAELVPEGSAVDERSKKAMAGIRSLAKDHLTYMSGMQIFLKRDLPICRGHQILLDSPWGLTSISQMQFWSDESKATWQKEARDVQGVLSVDISSWDMPGSGGRKASEAENSLVIYREVMGQLRLTLGTAGLEDEGPAANVLGFYLEDHREPILVNARGTWDLRPRAKCGQLENFFLAGDYTQTRSDLACMEAANESGRHAANGILRAEGRPERARIFDPFEHEPKWLKVLQEMDGYRYRRGLPWGGVDLSHLLVSTAWALDAIGDQVLADDVATKSRSAPASDAEPIRLPRDLWDPNRMPSTTGARTSVQAQIEEAAARARPARDEDVRDFLKDGRASPGRNDPMFRRWRLHALREKRSERDQEQEYLIPFHVYEGDCLVIHGRADLAPLRALTWRTGYHPVVGEELEGGPQWGFAELWIVDYRDTSAGAYRELVLNFVVTKRERHPKYRLASPYSSFVPMMDPQNRLFTPMLLVDQTRKIRNAPGAIQYGNDLFGTHKVPARIAIKRDASTGFKEFNWVQTNLEIDKGGGRVCEVSSPFQDAADYLQLSRVMGLAEVVRGARQAMNGEELAGGLVTPDRRGNAPRGATVDIRAAYKFAPKIRVLRRNEGVTCNDPEGKWRTLANQPRLDALASAGSNLSLMLSLFRFEPTIATYDHHLKSVLYLDGWPTPEGLPLP